MQGLASDTWLDVVKLDNDVRICSFNIGYIVICNKRQKKKDITTIIDPG